ncbi:PREDICTED: LRR receptor-like serine/threonine-protein kinase ERL2 [Nelumbo nucifera]|uniref:LRR receptor-like serine/threonine-protein kinase ERL2 n=1 Tax=Nelumbo nucifera TaxID=4432 RepID=A0A1U8Q171_NELNU|nr:PREDICTED: LRR receptor-like serine/threonine-protein kinase ERL2 [Nelumbo nucifera]
MFKLKYLFSRYRGNNLTGTILDISYNQITGEIPYNIGFLQVATLSLQGNRLTGKIPEVIGLMQALAVLDLSENELFGPIPPILSNLSYTGKLYLHENKLTGKIPPELGNMSKVSYLQLNDNELVGGIPAELGKLEELFEFPKASKQDALGNSLENRISLENCSPVEFCLPPLKLSSLSFFDTLYASLSLPLCSFCFPCSGERTPLDNLISPGSLLPALPRSCSTSSVGKTRTIKRFVYDEGRKRRCGVSEIICGEEAE